MTWFRIDDSFADHPRVVAAGNAAIGLWTKAGAWSMRHLTEGFIPTAIARQLGTPAEAKKLVTVGLWLVVDDGFMFFRFAEGADGTKRQETKEEAEARKRNARDRQRRRRGGAQETTTIGDLPSADVTPDVTRDSRVSHDVVTRPSSSSSSSSPPSEGESAADKPRSPRAGATRIPEPFVLTREMREWAADETPNVDPDRATREFVDFWRGATRDATKKDWVAVWRNRMRVLQKPHDQAATLPTAKNRDERALDVIEMGRRLGARQRGEIEA